MYFFFSFLLSFFPSLFPLPSSSPKGPFIAYRVRNISVVNNIRITDAERLKGHRLFSAGIQQQTMKTSLVSSSGRSIARDGQRSIRHGMVVDFLFVFVGSPALTFLVFCFFSLLSLLSSLSLLQAPSAKCI